MRRLVRSGKTAALVGTLGVLAQGTIVCNVPKFDVVIGDGEGGHDRRGNVIVIDRGDRGDDDDEDHSFWFDFWLW